MREALEYAFAWTLLRLMGTLPRGAVRRVGAALGAVAWWVLAKLRRTGLRNLELAYPEMPSAERTRILRGVYRQLGWQLGEFCQMRRYTPESTRTLFRYEGLEHYLAARERGQGVLVVTGHVGGWELSSFWHSLMGHPMTMVIRRLDNARVDRMVNEIRCMHGNRVVHKDDFARGAAGGDAGRATRVGILMDTNMTPAAGGVRAVFLGSWRVRRRGWRGWRCAQVRRCCRDFWCGKQQRGNTCCISGRSLRWRRQVTMSAMCSKTRRDSRRRLRCSCAGIRSSGYGVHRRWKTRPEGEAPAVLNVRQ
jgi:KDO2-lipid IV(A) lauroyltransferase